MVASVLVHPVPQGRFTDTEFTRDLRDRPRRVDDQLHRVLTELRRENPLTSSHFPIPSSQWIKGLLGEFRACFTAPTFMVFCALATGFVAQTGRRTVCGMLVGARLSRVWNHHRAHRFFSAPAWSPEQLSVARTALS